MKGNKFHMLTEILLVVSHIKYEENHFHSAQSIIVALHSNIYFCFQSVIAMGHEIIEAITVGSVSSKI